MKKFVLFGVIAISVLSLLGCPHTNPPPDPPEEKVAHIDYPDWNENKVDDREETLTPKDRVELFSILDYQEKHEDKGWMAKVVDVSSVVLNGTLGYDEYGFEGVLNALFEEKGDKFNQDVSNWDVSNVTNMTGLFFADGELLNFNQDVSNWNVGNVIEMGGMFLDAKSFNQDLGDWSDKIDKVEDFSYMFMYTAMNQNLSSWDVTGKITTEMFKFSPMEYKPTQHPQGCKCGASSSDPENPYPTEYGTWSHAAE